MKWSNRRQSSNVEDRRGGVTRAAGIGGLGTVIVILISMFFGFDPSTLLSVVDTTTRITGVNQQSSEYQPTAEEREMGEFVAVVLADTEDVWNNVFAQNGKKYQEPKLVLFSGSINSACGMAEAAMGPFYCPGDQKVYIDLSFFDDMKKKYHAPGDFAQAYVIAHEVGHHVQNLLGISDQVQRARGKVGKTKSNALSVRLELQADCFAGVWGNHTEKAKHILEQGDIEEALNAASAIGDDRLQKQSTGYVNPDSFTHGSSEQRVSWFKKGIRSGNLQDCDTFSVR
jgi:predicted metalloprotease